MPDYGWYAEMEKRGKLNEADQSWYNEMKTRGLVPTAPQEPDTFMQDNPEQIDKMAESYMLAESMDMDPDQAYDMHGELTKQMAEQEISFSKEVKDGIVGGMRVAGATFASLGSGIAGGIVGLTGMPVISASPDKWIEFKPGLLTGATLEESTDLIQEVAGGPPSAFIKTEEEAKVMELMDLIPQKAAEGWAMIGEGYVDSVIALRQFTLGEDAETADLEEQRQVMVPLLASIGEVSGEFAEFLPMAAGKMKTVLKKAQGTKTYQALSPKQRADYAENVVDTMKENPDLTEDQIIEAVEPQVTETGQVIKGQKIRDLNLAATETKAAQREKAPMGFDLEVRSYEGDGYKTTQISEGDKAIQNKFKIEIEPERKEALASVIQDVKRGEAGGRAFVEAEIGGGADVIGYGSTYPEFMRNEGWTGKEVVNALSKAVDGKDLGSRQAQIVESAIDYVNTMATETPGFEGFKEYTFGAEPKRKIPSKQKLIQILKDDKLLPEIARLRFTEAIRTSKDKNSLRNIAKGMEKGWELAIERKYTSDVITSKRLEKVDNLRKTMKFPTIKNMTMKQMGEFQTVLEPFQKDDVFLTQRQLETIDRSDLAGVKTTREVRQKFSERTGVPLAEISPISVEGFDKWMYDHDLAKQSPFHRVAVEDYHNTMLSAEERYLDFEAESNTLAKAARDSRKQGFWDKLIPTDDLVFDYLEATDKSSIAEKMTPQELEYANWLEGKFAEALEYLIDTESLKTGRENYMTNIRKDFFETFKDEGFKAAGKGILNQQKLDEQSFVIMDQKTGQILPLNKFFKFSMQRTGDITPTKNVAKSASNYFRTLERKKALDSYMPKMMAYTDMLTPEAKTKGGIIKDESLTTFFKEWINTKKGRPSEKYIRPGGKMDMTVKGLKAFVSMKDLAFNIPVGMVSQLGEGISVYRGIGKKGVTKAIKRLNTKQGKKITTKYKNLVGKSIWEQLYEPSLALSDKMTGAMFGFFNQGAVRANKIDLLGRLTDKEFETGDITPERLAEIKLDMSKWRVQGDMKSIYGTTTEGGLFTHYKSWAIPHLVNTYRDLGTLAKSFADKSQKGTLKTEEFQQFKNAAEITAAAVIALSVIPDDDSFIGQAKARVKREALTILGALDPTFWLGTPRLAQWAAEMAEISLELITLEGYSEDAPMELRGKLKGVEHLKSMATPGAAKILQGEETTGLAN